MNQPVSSPQLHPASFCALDFLRTLVVALVAGFFTPVVLLRRKTIGASLRAEFLRHLRPFELLLPRILVFEALNIASSLRIADKTRKSPGASPGRPQATLDPDDASNRPAAFCIVPLRGNPSDRNARALIARMRRFSQGDADKRQAPMARRESLSKQPLALRLQALIRAVSDPDPHVQRLARRFSKAMPRQVEALFAPRFTPWAHFNAHLQTLEAEVTHRLVQFASSSGRCGQPIRQDLRLAAGPRPRARPKLDAPRGLP